MTKYLVLFSVVGLLLAAFFVSGMNKSAQASTVPGCPCGTCEAGCTCCEEEVCTCADCSCECGCPDSAAKVDGCPCGSCEPGCNCCDEEGPCTCEACTCEEACGGECLAVKTADSSTCCGTAGKATGCCSK